MWFDHGPPHHGGRCPRRRPGGRPIAASARSPRKPSLLDLAIAVGDADVGSPLGGRYLGDDSDDPLANDVREAVEHLPYQDLTGCWRGTEEPIGSALAGRDCRSPSIVWHSQALASLFELGFAPTAPAAARHLEVLARRLTPGAFDSPEADDLTTKDWLLKARHLTWILACLSEYQPIEVDSQGLDREAYARIATHRDVVMAAYDALVGDPHSDGPSSWVAPRDDPGKEEWWWSEYFDGRHPNLLNSIYAVLGICRAERHGFHREAARYEVWAREAPSASTRVSRFISAIDVVSAPGGPRVSIRGNWEEEWARKPQLPPSIIGLLCLTMVEYGRLLLSLPAQRSSVRPAGQVFAKAQRLGHALVQLGQGRAGPRWTRSIEAFFQQAAHGSAWYTYAASICARAVLESAAVEPRHQVVRDAFETLAGLERRRDGTVTWIDPTRPVGDFDPIGDEARATQSGGFAAIDVRPWLARQDAESSAASIHAVAMAYSGLRRATARVDPRRAFDSGKTYHPRSPFDRLELDLNAKPDDENVRLFNERHGYVEEASASPGTRELLWALKEHGGPASAATIVWKIRELVGREPTLNKAQAVRSRIVQVNRAFGFELVRVAGGRQRRTDGAGTRYELGIDVKILGWPRTSRRAPRPGASRRTAVAPIDAASP